MTDTGLDKSQSRNGIQVIGRAAAVLRALRDNPEGMSLGQIAERVDLARSTVQRIVAALQEERLVITMGTGGIRLGPEVTSLANAARLNIVEYCRPLLTELVQRTGETADLSVLRGQSMIFLDQMPGIHRLRTVSAVGDIFPLTDTANGRAVLANLPTERARQLTINEWLNRQIEGDWTSFAKMLDQVRDSGLAYDREEHTSDISAIGISFADWAGDLHAISVPVPASRFPRCEAAVARALTNLRGRLEETFRPYSQTI